MAHNIRITVDTEAEFRDQIRKAASQGYATVQSGTGYMLMSRKKPFNWVLAIICLFIPVIGWIALIMMLMAAGRGATALEIEMKQPANQNTALEAGDAAGTVAP